eukprot:COSAG02_NODE_48688_length_332_cov_0.635193_1_plen_72_part_01
MLGGGRAYRYISGVYIGHTRVASLVLRRAVASALGRHGYQRRGIAPTKAVALWSYEFSVPLTVRRLELHGSC